MCGCLGSIKRSKPRPRELSSNISVSRTPVCLQMEEEIRELERKTLFLLTKDTTDTVLSGANVQLRVWFRALSIECPDEYEYNIIKQYVENEYTKYNS